MTGSGPAHPLWKGDLATTNAGRARAQRWFPLGTSCEYEGCEASAADRHHVDGNTLHNSRENVLLLCRRHHMALDGRLDELARHSREQEPHPPRPCRICGREWRPLRVGRCERCASYFYDHGYERPADPFAPKPCRICDRLSKPLRRGRCGRCRTYFTAHGHEWSPS